MRSLPWLFREVRRFKPDVVHTWLFAANIWGPFRGWFVTVTGLTVDGAGNVFAPTFTITGCRNSAPTARF